MIFTPKNQLKIYGHEILFNNLVNLFETNKLPNKIILSGLKGIGKCTFSLHLSNYILSKKESLPYDLINNEIDPDNKSFKLIQNFTHPNFYLIDLLQDKKNIEISQIRNMINYTNKSSFNDSPKIILIDNFEYLNVNSVNALLKIIEDPNDNVFFILIHNSNKKILNTIKSRCIKFHMKLSFDENISITNKLIKSNIFDILNQDIISFYDTIGHYIYLVEYSKIYNLDLKNLSLKDLLLHLIDQKIYLKDTFIKSLLLNLIELYFLKLIHISNNKNIIFSFYSAFMKKINYVNKFNLDYESLFMEFKKKIINE